MTEMADPPPPDRKNLWDRAEARGLIRHEDRPDVVEAERQQREAAEQNARHAATMRRHLFWMGMVLLISAVVIGAMIVRMLWTRG